MTIDIYKLYYKRIKTLNIEHYAGEVSYYSKANLRPAENALLNGLPGGSKILDVGCGSGRFSIEAAKRGFNVTGIDITPAAINSCKTQAKILKLSNAKFEVLDIVEGGINKKFDYVFCPRFVINAIATKRSRKAAIKNIINACRPGGYVYIESFNIWYMGKGPGRPFKNSFLTLYRSVNLEVHKILKIYYGGLFPGDIVYKANKASTASQGYAHLPNIFEIRRYLKNSKTKSIYQIIGVKNHDWLKLFRYSIWVIAKI